MQEEALVALRLNAPPTQLPHIDRIALGMVAAEISAQFRQPFVERTGIPRRQ